MSDELEKQTVPATEGGEDEDVEAHKHAVPKHSVPKEEGAESDDDVEAHRHDIPRHDIARHDIA